MVSSDGRYATCQCPTHCPNYGDHSKSRPVCGTNGQDYPDLCTLRMDACSSNSNITVKYEGKCGKNRLDFLTLARIFNTSQDF